MNKKKIFLFFILVVIILFACFAIFRTGNSKTEDSEKINIVVSNFASYDFLRAIIGENKNVVLKFLLGPGKDAHSYDPTANDLITIKNADLFVYIGGEMENWSEKVISSLDGSKRKIICISELVDTIEEKEVDGAEAEEEEEEEGTFDEHIWTSPANAVKMVEILEKEMEEIDSKNTSTYKENAEKYISAIKEVDLQIRQIVDNRVRDRLVFGDKMPMQYFIDYYGLKVSATFSGCSTETEPSASTIAYLEKKVKEEEIPVVLYIELNNGKVANTIASEVPNCKAMQIQTLHNISLYDFNNGETWVSLMTRNLDVLKKALQ